MSTMAKIIINKGFISLHGQLYGAGSVISVADNNEAKRLVARSSGDFSFYQGNVPESGTDEPADEGIPAENDVLDSGTEDAGEDSGDGLPALDPDAAMQTGKGNKGDKGKKK